MRSSSNSHTAGFQYFVVPVYYTSNTKTRPHIYLNILPLPPELTLTLPLTLLTLTDTEALRLALTWMNLRLWRGRRRRPACRVLLFASLPAFFVLALWASMTGQVRWRTISVGYRYSLPIYWRTTSECIGDRRLNWMMNDDADRCRCLPSEGDQAGRRCRFMSQARLTDLHAVSQKTGPFFSFQFNYCPIIIILSLLQTEINYDKVYHKIYHHTSNLLVHCLVKWTRMYWPTLYDFVIKDVTVKQVTVNVADMDKINIVSSHRLPWNVF